MENIANNVGALLKKQSEAVKYYHRLYTESQKEIKQLIEDNLFLQRLLATAIQGHVVVYRPEDEKKIPDFKLEENIEGELIVSLNGWKISKKEAEEN